MTAWDQTPEGSAVNQAYETWKQLWNQLLPGHKQSADNLATRPIKG